MPASAVTSPYICARCLRANRRLQAFPARSNLRCVPLVRTFAGSAPQPQKEDEKSINLDEQRQDARTKAEEKEEGAMSRRLRDMSDDALEAGGRRARKAVEEAGFSDELKRELEERIASANFRAENRRAFTEAEMPSYAGQESIHDASLRMLNDAHKPLRLGRAPKIPGPSAPLPKRVDTGRSKVNAGTRLANARDRTSVYAHLKESDMSEKEREKRFQELKDRFSPGARSIVPGTLQGLASLANERIEDAIARGQFKNLPNRGKQIERDYNASNPFLDTTEYFMNKMIQKQEIVPPWIEKQQELVTAANKFRSRLRADWRRHAARMIASKGGSLQDQMRKAEAFAKAELIVNPPKDKSETINTVNETGHVSQISLSGELKVPSDSDSPLEEVIKAARIDFEDPSTPESSTVTPEDHTPETLTLPVQSHSASPTVPPAPHPFRDPSWLETETAYLTLAINDLNNKTRSYNLQAPDLAKKPYFSLDRELKACYADVAPQLADAIRERALSPKAKTVGFSESLGGGGGVMERLTEGPVRVRDERAGKQYGFRQFWKDVWGERRSV
ncbi:hypothetical protein BDV96DRAFT_491323 [Lophiotrema nucula]|uniref:DnaJ homologue subfamily C member 28 conserved domain-containing protein n=1 Tax=Lophiotrema nucula TaxID=690887 RepID=A0A6A5ZA42_9PLEO|nr:hypothetical protein BDV96DRAFT_491323 [Lophiotrema nucula]